MTMGIKKSLFAALALSGVLLSGCGGSSQMSHSSSSSSKYPVDQRVLSNQEFTLLNLSGTDALGRLISKADSLKSGDHYVGLFYFAWLGQHDYAVRGSQGVHDISLLLSTEEGKKALYDNTLGDDSLSPMDRFHFWGKPLYGYYNMTDPWVLSKHIELFTMAGIDYLCLDATNSVIYEDSVHALLSVILKYQAQGWKTPKLMFYTNSASGSTIKRLYNAYYTDAQYDSCWFAPAGKPRIVGVTTANNKASDQTKYSTTFSDYVTDDMLQYFDVKESEWPNGDFNANSQPWMSWVYPQTIHDGHLCAPVAQHSHSRICFSLKDPESSRGYDNVRNTRTENANAGYSWQQMWNTALEEKNGVKDVFCTGWNEWMAIKSYNLAYDGVYFVDTFNEEYSRDIEMMEGGYGDNFYLQLVENARKYKLNAAREYAQKEHTISIASFDETQWVDVKNAYQDFAGDAEERNHTGAVSTLTYTEKAASNDIVSIKLAHDQANIYFRIECANPIVEDPTAENFLNILLDSGKNSDSFSSFDYLINRSHASGKASIERFHADGSKTSVSEATYSVAGKIMQLCLPRSAVGLGEEEQLHFSFKVADGVANPSDIMSYYKSGDSAPIGRLSYAY